MLTGQASYNVKDVGLVTERVAEMTVRWGKLVAFVAAFQMLAGMASAGDTSAPWPQWRGPHRDGQFSGPAWPDTLQGERLKAIWRNKLGPSYSGPIVAADRVFVTETRGNNREVVQALNRETGAKLWEVEWRGSLSVPFFAKANGDWIRSTPTFDGEYLYVGGIRDVLVCLSGADGKERWRVDFVERFKSPLPAFGMVCSPVVTTDAVYVQAGASLVKLNKQTGATVWQSLNDGGGMNGSAFSSPIIATLQGEPQLVVQTRTKLTGVDLTSGNVLWSQDVPAFRGMNILTPTVLENSLFTSTYGGKTFRYAINKVADKYQVAVTWEKNSQGYMSSPIVIKDSVYVHLKNQRFACYDLKTGAERWRTEPFGRYWSMIANGNQILALDERGDLLLIKATPEKYIQLDSRKISEQETWAHLAVAGDQIFIRELGAISAFQWRRD